MFFSCLVGRGYTMYRLPIQWMYRSVVFPNNFSMQWFMRYCQLCVCIHINMGVFINNLLPYIVLIKKNSVKKSLKKVHVSFLTYTPVLIFVWSWPVMKRWDGYCVRYSSLPQEGHCAITAIDKVNFEGSHHIRIFFLNDQVSLRGGVCQMYVISLGYI